MRSGLTIATWAACVWLALGGVARADRLDALLRAAHDPSWRVRLQAASVLAKLKSADAVPIVEQLLGDENDNVRGVAAAALGELARAPNVDQARLRMDLERMDADRSPVVQEHARHALKLIAAVEAKQHKATEPDGSVGGTMHVAIGGVGAKQKNVPPELTRRLRELLVREFSHTPGLTLDGTPVSGFLIDSSITALTRHTTREWVEINCEVSVIVGRLPSKAMVMMTSGGATVQQPKGSPASAATLEADALEGAVKGAHENLLAYLRARR
jgi:hypothetical protein